MRCLTCKARTDFNLCVVIDSPSCADVKKPEFFPHSRGQLEEIMVNRKMALLLVFLIAGSCHPFKGQSPAEAAKQFYGNAIKFSSGLPPRTELQSVSRLMTPELQGLFQRAQKDQDEYVGKNPADKPPWVEGCLFASLFEVRLPFRPAGFGMKGKRPWSQSGSSMSCRRVVSNGPTGLCWSDMKVTGWSTIFFSTETGHSKWGET